ncbi:MAG: cell division protease FtsH [Candidatus Krumholzibacteriia bacterium]
MAEELFLGKIGSGASSDIQQVTSMARTMVTQLGMSEKMGPISYQEGGGQVFLGRDYGSRTTHSEKTLQDIDGEVQRIVDEQLQRARKILDGKREYVESVTAALLERETIDGEEFKMLMEDKELPAVVLEVDHSVSDDKPLVSDDKPLVSDDETVASQPTTEVEPPAVSDEDNDSEKPESS